MSALSDLKRHLRPGQVYRRKDLARWSNAVDRHVRQLVDEGRLSVRRSSITSRSSTIASGTRSSPSTGVSMISGCGHRYPSGYPKKSCWSICCIISIGCRKTNRQCFRARSSGRRKWTVRVLPRPSRILAPDKLSDCSRLFSSRPEGVRCREYPASQASGHSPRFK